jgi:hypothetical protein
MGYKLPKGMKPLKPAGDSYSDSIRAKIKGSSSEKRKIAQKINSIPRMNEENVEKAAWELISNENLSAAHIERLILEMLKKPLKEELRAKLIDTAIKAHQAIHGSKTKNLNLNIDMTSEKVLNRLKEWKEKQKKMN